MRKSTRSAVARWITVGVAGACSLACDAILGVKDVPGPGDAAVQVDGGHKAVDAHLDAKGLDAGSDATLVRDGGATLDAPVSHDGSDAHPNEAAASDAGHDVSAVEAGCGDTLNNPLHCGSCANACSANQTCADGGCASCAGDASVCANACVNEQTDMQNCGGCGLSCSQPCVKGLCVETLDSVAATLDVASDGANVYWTEPYTHRVMKSDLDGSHRVVLATTAASEEPSDIAVQDGYVYFTDQLGMAPLQRVPTSGGEGAVPLYASGPSALGVALDANWAYFTDFGGGNILRVALAGGTPQTLVPLQSSPRRIAVNATNLYWTNSVASGSVMSATLDGGMPTQIASGYYPFGITIDATHVYWTTFTSTVMSLPFTGGTPVTLYSSTNRLSGIAVDSDNLYFADQAAYWILWMPKTGGGPYTFVNSAVTSYFVAVDSTSVYWTSFAQADAGVATVSRVTPK